MPTIIAVAGDLHTNCTVGLCSPIVALDDGGQYRASREQRAVWREWLKFWNEVGAARDEAGARLIIVLNGELADDNHHVTLQLITRNPQTQMAHAVEVLKPALDLLREGDRVYVTRGTEAHSGPSAWMDEAIARDIGATGETPDGPASWWQLLLNVEGVRIQVAHHPPPGGGRLPEARARWAIATAGNIVRACVRRSEPIPHLIIYGHVHNPADSWDAEGDCRVLVLPAWQLKTSYGFRIGGTPLPIGGAWFLIDRGRIERVEKRYTDWRIGTYQHA